MYTKYFLLLALFLINKCYAQVTVNISLIKHDSVLVQLTIENHCQENYYFPTHLHLKNKIKFNSDSSCVDILLTKPHFEKQPVEDAKIEKLKIYNNTLNFINIPITWIDDFISEERFIFIPVKSQNKTIINFKSQISESGLKYLKTRCLLLKTIIITQNYKDSIPKINQNLMSLIESTRIIARYLPNNGDGVKFPYYGEGINFNNINAFEFKNKEFIFNKKKSDFFIKDYNNRQFNGCSDK